MRIPGGTWRRFTMEMIAVSVNAGEYTSRLVVDVDVDVDIQSLGLFDCHHHLFVIVCNRRFTEYEGVVIVVASSTFSVEDMMMTKIKLLL